MKPDSWMPLYGNEYFAAVDPYPPEVGLSYLRAIWYYWHAAHGEGLPDDSESLRRICRVDRADWPDIKPILFGQFFLLGEDGLWHQKRAQIEFQTAQSRYEKAVRNGRKGGLRSGFKRRGIG